MCRIQCNIYYTNGDDKLCMGLPGSTEYRLQHYIRRYGYRQYCHDEISDSKQKTVTINYTNAGGCTATTATSSTATVVSALPVVTFTAQPGVSACVGSNVTYTTQTGMTSYVWVFPGVLNTDYSITSGGTGTDNTVTMKYLTASSKTVTINYTNAGG